MIETRRLVVVVAVATLPPKIVATTNKLHQRKTALQLNLNPTYD
jgi:hypothetical protein